MKTNFLWKNQELISRKGGPNSICQKLRKDWCERHISTRLRWSDIGIHIQLLNIIYHNLISGSFWCCCWFHMGKMDSSVSKTFLIIWAFSIKAVAHFQPATPACRFKMLNTPDAVRKKPFCMWRPPDSHARNRLCREAKILLLRVRVFTYNISTIIPSSFTVPCTWRSARRFTRRKEPFSPTYWWTRVNTLQSGIHPEDATADIL